LRTVPHGQVTVALQVATSHAQVTGRGKHRKRVVRVVVLYSADTGGIADGRGRFTGRLRLSYRARTPMQAGLLATVRSGSATATRRLQMTLLPAHYPRPS
jgi:hypothetical protein